MAATISIARSQDQAVSLGNFRGRYIQVAPAASDYPTGGYPITPASVGLSEILGVVVVGLNNAAITSGFYWQFNVSTQKLQAFWTGAVVSTALAEVTASTDVSADKVFLLIFGY